MSDTIFPERVKGFVIGKMVSDTVFTSGPHSSVVEHFLGKEEVTGSSPVVGSNKN